MPYTKTEICNESLSLINASTLLSDFATDITPAGKLCRLYFDTSVEALLEAYPWTFAGRRKKLTTPNINTPEFEFAYAFQLPADFLNVVTTNIPVDSRWAVEGTELLTNWSPVELKYTARVLNTAVFTPLFRQTVAFFLASKLAIPIARSHTYADMYAKATERILARGEHTNSLATNEQFDNETLIDVRFGAAQHGYF